eukprot:140525_1
MSSFTKLDPLGISVRHYIPKPVYDLTDNNCIIISTDYEENQTTAGIHKYNMQTNELQTIYKYDNALKPEFYGQFIDPSNGTLILFGGSCDIFEVFDLRTNKMKQKNGTNNILSKCGDFPQNTFIPSPMNQIHILDNSCNHFKFDITNKETIE